MIAPFDRLELETMRDPSYWVRQAVSPTPTACNGIVEIRRFRITVERIDETPEVLRDRIVKLWREGERNQHHRDPLMSVYHALGATAAEVEELRNTEMGCDFKPRRAM